MKGFLRLLQEVQVAVSSSYVWTMDDLFPVFQYVVVRACIRHLGSEIHMIDDLMEKRLQNGELGMMFTMLKVGPISFLEFLIACDQNYIHLLKNTGISCLETLKYLLKRMTRKKIRSA